jgi:drug/metabolite transporter (DMT)-like permease
VSPTAYPPKRAGKTASDTDVGARLMLAALCLIWGLTWPLMKIALYQMLPLTMRASSGGLGALTLYLFCLVTHRSFHVPSAKAWVHIFIASMLTVVGFTVISAFAQLIATTGRVTILAYTMPVWTVLLAWPFLGERPSRVQAIALGLCAIGLAVLIYPLAATGVPFGILLAVTVGISWAAGTVYLKWAHIDADPIGVACWQLIVAFVVIAAFMLIFEGLPHFEKLRASGLFALAFTGIVGNGVAYGLWFAVVRRLPAVAASLGVLAVPVVGIIASYFILGEIPTTADLIGFALIFTASACVLLSRPAPVEAPSQLS